jgi:hypothetical protein
MYVLDGFSEKVDKHFTQLQGFWYAKLWLLGECFSVLQGKYSQCHPEY